MLEVTGIEKRYRGRTILKNVSFRANPRECIGIVGGNGCGKTTLLSILAGIRKPDRGRRAGGAWKTSSIRRKNRLCASGKSIDPGADGI